MGREEAAPVREAKDVAGLENTGMRRGEAGKDRGKQRA